MRIVHVVTLVSDDGAFGGPLRVALNQVAELRSRGHDATLIAGYRGTLPPPDFVDGVPVRLFPVRRVLPLGFSGLVSVGLLRWLARELEGLDLVHVHAGRDLITMPAMAMVRRAQRPFVVQTHGMITPSSRAVARLLDALATRRLLLAGSYRLVLTNNEEADLTQLLGRSTLRRLPNGVPMPVTKPTADGSDSAQEVLFLARLHTRKRPLAFVRVAQALHQSYPEVRWTIIGPDEGELAAVRAAIHTAGLINVVSYEGALAYDQVSTRLAQATVYVLPSIDEPFPMSLLEALSAGIPSVCTTSCGIASELEQRGAALVVDETQDELTNAVGRLLAEPRLRQELSAGAQAAVRELFSITAVVDELEVLYGCACSPGHPR